MAEERRSTVTSDDLSLPKIVTNKKVGLALGGGGARGLAHLGVLAVLEQEGIPIHYLAGSSIGAVIGACYACGLDVHKLIHTALQFRWRSLIDLNWNGRGLLKGERLEAFVDDLVDSKHFEHTNIPLAIISTDLNTGEEVIIREGPLSQAARASSAFPGVFTPVQVNGRWLFDGGVVNQVPADVVAAMGADVVIAVETNGSPQRQAMTSAEPPQGFISQLRSAVVPETRYPVMKDLIEKVIDIFIDQITNYRLRIDRPITVIRPAVGLVKLEDFRRAEECIAAGITAAEAQLPAIHRMLAEEIPPHPEEILPPRPPVIPEAPQETAGWLAQLRAMFQL